MRRPVKLGDLVAHTLDRGPAGIGLVMGSSPIRPGWSLVMFACNDKAWWYETGNLYVKSCREKIKK